MLTLTSPRFASKLVDLQDVPELTLLVSAFSTLRHQVTDVIKFTGVGRASNCGRDAVQKCRPGHFCRGCCDASAGKLHHHMAWKCVGGWVSSAVEGRRQPVQHARVECTYKLAEGDKKKGRGEDRRSKRRERSRDEEKTTTAKDDNPREEEKQQNAAMVKIKNCVRKNSAQITFFSQLTHTGFGVCTRCSACVHRVITAT